MAVYNATGILKKVIVANPMYHKLLPCSDTARNSIDEGKKVSMKDALAQHKEYVDAFKSAGIEVIFIEPILEDYPWQSGARDWGFMTKDGALIGKFRYYERKGEEKYVINTLKKYNYPIIGKINKGALEGGDCWYIDNYSVAIGFGNRSTETGVLQAKGILKEHDIEVIPIELYARWNHLDMNFSLLNENLAVGSADALPDYFKGFLKGKGIELKLYPREIVEGKCSLNLVPLGKDRIMSFKGNPINKDLKVMGFEVFDPRFSQFTMGGGGPHCFCHELDRDK
jgi:N-dimethylarginine dimethylaminohydrolase